MSERKDELEKKAAENVITISELDFIRTAAKATDSGMVKDLTDCSPALILAFALYSKEINKLLFYKEEENENVPSSTEALPS